MHAIYKQACTLKIKHFHKSAYTINVMIADWNAWTPMPPGFSNSAIMFSMIGAAMLALSVMFILGSLANMLSISDGMALVDIAMKRSQATERKIATATNAHKQLRAKNGYCERKMPKAGSLQKRAFSFVAYPPTHVGC